jgi:hypothetical protein
MKPMEITITIGAGLIPPAYLVRCSSAKVTRETTPTGTMLHIQFEPPLPVSCLLERLRQEAAEIMLDISAQSWEILWFMLNTPEGWATHQELTDHVWTKEIPPASTVSKAIAVLNDDLKARNFGYVVKSRKGFYRLTPIAR